MTIIPSIDAAVVSVRVIKRAPSIESFNGIDAHMTQEGNDITIETTGFDRNIRGRGEVAYEITMPKRVAAIQVRTMRGKYPVTIEGIAGDLDIYAESGEISISDYNGNVVARTNVGTIEIVNGQGQVEKRTGVRSPD